MTGADVPIARPQLPTLEALAARLGERSRGHVGIDVDIPLLELPVDSLDLIEFFYEVAKELELDEDRLDNFLGDFFDSSLRRVYTLLSEFLVSES